MRLVFIVTALVFLLQASPLVLGAQSNNASPKNAPCKAPLEPADFSSTLELARQWMQKFQIDSKGWNLSHDQRPLHVSGDALLFLARFVAASREQAAPKGVSAISADQAHALFESAMTQGFMMKIEDLARPHRHGCVTLGLAQKVVHDFIEKEVRLLEGEVGEVSFGLSKYLLDLKKTRFHEMENQVLQEVQSFGRASLLSRVLQKIEYWIPELIFSESMPGPRKISDLSLLDRAFYLSLMSQLAAKNKNVMANVYTDPLSGTVEKIHDDVLKGIEQIWHEQTGKTYSLQSTALFFEPIPGMGVREDILKAIHTWHKMSQEEPVPTVSEKPVLNFQMPIEGFCRHCREIKI